MNDYDILIIGGGPIGMACGLAAQRAGFSYVIIEKGCLTNSLYNYPLNMTFFSTSDKLEIGGVPFVSTNAKPTRSEALEYYRRVSFSNVLNIRLFEEVTSLDAISDTQYEVKTSKAIYQATHIIVATGFYDIPMLMNVAGEDLPNVTHYYKDPHFYAGQKVLVVGANNSAVDAALETYRKGADVTMVVREDEIGKRVKYWVRPDIINRIAEGSIKAYFNSTVHAIEPHHVYINTPEGVISVENDWGIAMTGYQPNLAFLQKIGIELDKNNRFHPHYNPDNQESNLPRVYLAGVVCGGLDTHVWFIENSRIHAEKIIDNLNTTLRRVSNPKR
jgi:thioredoxin reductase (NADPH)